MNPRVTFFNFRNSVIDSAPTFVKSVLCRSLLKDPWAATEFSRNCLFIHIPRTGGSSITNSILGKNIGHNTLTHYHAFDKARTKNAFKMCIVRNPWDRLVSAYHQMEKRDTNPHVKAYWESLKIGSFDKLLDFLSFQRSRSRVMKIVHFRDQISMIECEDCEMDFIGRFEQYDKSAQHICSAFKIYCNMSLTNATKRGDYRTYYDRASAELVGKVYQRDIDAFGYSF